MTKTNLGKGLSALIPDEIRESFQKHSESGADKPAEKTKNTKSQDNSLILEIEISHIIPNPFQPRKKFDQDALESLAESIKTHGLLQPITVIEKDEGIYELIAGERRMRASQLAGIHKIPAIIKNADDINKLEIALIENIQRKDLNPIEEARAYQKLIDEFNLTQEQVSQKIKKSRSTIANLIRYLKLPLEIQEGLMEGKISEGHAKVISALDNIDAQIALYQKTVKDNLSVRSLESFAEEINVSGHKRKIKPKLKSSLAQKEKTLADLLGLKVELKPGKKGGKIILNYFSDDDLDRVIRLIEEEK